MTRVREPDRDALGREQVVPRLVVLIRGSEGPGGTTAREDGGPVRAGSWKICSRFRFQRAPLPGRGRADLAVDPSATALRMAGKRIAASAIPVEQIGLDGQSLPSTTSAVTRACASSPLCTNPDAGAALAEVRRVLRPGGRFDFLEHGLPLIPRWSPSDPGGATAAAGSPTGAT